MGRVWRVAVVVAVVAGGLLGGVGGAGAEADRSRRCERGEFCLWEREFYRGDGYRVSLETTNPGECVALPAGMRSFVNRSSREVTVYQGAGCSTEGEFGTYPGGGTYVPQAPYVVRGVQIWPG